LHVIYLKAFASVRLLIDLYLLESNIWTCFFNCTIWINMLRCKPTLYFKYQYCDVPIFVPVVISCEQRTNFKLKCMVCMVHQREVWWVMLFKASSFPWTICRKRKEILLSINVEQAKEFPIPHR
jgi:hypothetical protein